MALSGIGKEALELLRIKPDVATRRQTVDVFLATSTAWQRVATIATGGYDREVDCF
jgi:hypothetical protein